ncbi:MAG: hypoxanthine-guanine phosphoribosyltransferase [Methanoregula sp. PtaU1.Bin051]|nr:MAG: hypoxanthine-guanine phosphoribosyltransferase [Methanoregula sp. PtaU1.Bin051]
MSTIIEDHALREKRFIFTDRHDAGRRLGALIRTRPALVNPVVLAIPAGGVPVGIEIAIGLGVPLSLAIVRKVRIPGSTEAGFGAVTWDGRVLINDRLRAALRLSQEDVDAAVITTRRNVEERINRFTKGRPFPDIAGKTTILVDDGLASGFTMLAALTSIKTLHPLRILVAVPTASASSIEVVARQCDEIICANIRGGRYFAVAEAYREWYDLDDREVMAELARV